MMDSFQKTMSRMRDTVLTGSIPSAGKRKHKRSYGKLLVIFVVLFSIGGAGYYIATSDSVSDTLSQYGGTSAQFKHKGADDVASRQPVLERDASPSYVSEAKSFFSTKSSTADKHQGSPAKMSKGKHHGKKFAKAGGHKGKKFAKKAGKKHGSKLSHKHGKAKHKKKKHA